jgi:predicted ATPase
MSGKKPRPFRVVVTGGPCAGKTEIWRLLGERFPEAVRVQEAASELILAGETPDRLGQDEFQRRVYQRQISLEKDAQKRGFFLICDRGVVDGLAYCPGILQRLGVSLDAAMARYALVLQLAVIPDPELYRTLCRNNPARHEDHPRALELEKALRRIYSQHPAHHFLWGSKEGKLSAAVQFILQRKKVEEPDLDFSPAEG